MKKEADMEKLSIATIKRDLLDGRMKFGNIRVNVQESVDKGRWQAFVQTPNFNTMLQTPPTANAESLRAFCERIAPSVLDYHRQGA